MSGSPAGYPPGVRIRIPAALLVSLAAWTACPSVQAASPAPARFPIVDGSVHSVLVDGRTAYIGGHFTSVGEATGPLAFLDPRSGTVRRGFPSISGQSSDEANEDWAGVRAVEPDGDGGLYVAGHFSSVAGRRRSAIAHLRADGSLDPRFRAGVTGRVESLALARGRLWIGGTFERAAGGMRHGLAVVDARTGALTAGGTPTPGSVGSLAHAGGRVYASGFTDGLVAYDAATGARLPWRPDPYLPRPEAMVVRGDKLYLAAASALELDAASGRILRSFAPDAGTLQDVAIGGHTLVLGSSRYSNETSGLVAFDLRTGERLARFAGVEADVRTLAVHRGTVYASRVWRTGGKNRGGGLLAFDLATGKVRWAHHENTTIWDMRMHSGRLVVAGQMRVLGGARRQNLAAIDLPTGRVLPRFRPRIAGIATYVASEPYVAALAKRGRRLYAGGSFLEVDGRPQGNLVALDARSGRRRGTLPSANGPVHALARAGSTLYAGGEFSALGGEPRNALGAIGLPAGRVGAWNPDANDDVSALVLTRGTLYAGGSFDRIGGAELPGLAAFGARSGALSARFRPQSGWPVAALAADGRGGVWAAGSFGGLADGDSIGLARLDASGRRAGGVPVVDGHVYALAARGDRVYVGGTFHRVGGHDRAGLAAIRGGRVTAFDPHPHGRWPRALVPLPGGRLLTAGEFNSMELRATSGLAMFRSP